MFGEPQTQQQKKKEPALRRLRRVANQLESGKDHVKRLTEQRNQLILEAIEIDGVTERQAAENGKVSPTYAHRVRRAKGQPLSGPAMDDARALAKATASSE